jgi:hypothetical protein
MYTEGFDDLSEAESRPPRTYVSTGSQDSLKLQRENERLKKNLEKEQFFNRLLDQELKDLKNSPESGVRSNTEFYNRRSGISRTSFNTLLIILIALAAFVAYTLFSNKQNNLLPKPSAALETPSAPPSPVSDSVPNIISNKKVTLPMVQQQKVAEPEKAVAVKEPKTKPQVVVAENPAVVAEKPAVIAETVAEEPVIQPVPVQPAASERQVVGKYMVTSKANFYSAPDGNTLRSYFISAGNDKIVNALEDKNGFIYVEFKNDIGYVTKGWLSKADLTKQ